MLAASDWAGDCDCCAGITVETPFAIDNSPSLDRIAYRSGTYARFRNSIAARLSSSAFPALARLRTRSSDDFTIGLADGFAVMADVLTFYQERIANEAFLRTATERLSVRELARLLGYALLPGVAAETWLAFVLEETRGRPTGAASSVSIPAGTKVQSIPGQDELPQTFETIAAIDARVEHNAIRVQTREPQAIGPGLEELYLDGTGHQLSSGDVILIVSAERFSDSTSGEWDVRVLRTIEPDDRRGHTRIAWEEGLSRIPASADATAAGVQVFVFRQRAALFGHNAPDPRLLSRTGTNIRLLANLITGRWFDFEIQDSHIDLDQSYPKTVSGSWILLVTESDDPSETPPGRAALYRAASVSHRSRSDFGLAARVTGIDVDTSEHLAGFGLRETLVLAQSEALPIGERPVRSPVYRNKVSLAAIVRDLVPGHALAVSGKRQHVRVARGAHDLEFVLDAGSQIALAPGDRLALLAPPTLASSGIAPELVAPGLGLAAPGELPGPPDSIAAASTIVLVAHAVPTQALSLAATPGVTALLRWQLADRHGRPGTTVASAESLELDRAAEDDERLSEVAFISDLEDGVTEDHARTNIRLAAPLSACYERESVTLNANLVRATHGETISEAVGTGDASRRDQRFTLKQAPLTRVNAETPNGRLSTLEVRVDDRLWTEVASLYGARAMDRVYSTRDDDGGRTTMQFGDGVEGARLPTGQQNVRATYRKGAGSSGNVRAGQLATLMSRPLGVTAVTNPEAASGGQDGQDLADARRNAPLSVLTLDRAVSLRDYEDFARGFAGVAKAHAMWIENGPSQGVFLTVAGPSGAAIGTGSRTHQNLVAALRTYGDPLLALSVNTYAARTFRLGVSIKVRSDELTEQILDQVRTALETAFAFDQRDFGQPVSVDEVIAVIHGVAAVEAVDVNALRRKDQPLAPAVRTRLFAALPVIKSATVSPAELLTLDRASVEIGVMA